MLEPFPFGYHWAEEGVHLPMDDRLAYNAS